MKKGRLKTQKLVGTLKPVASWPRLGWWQIIRVQKGQDLVISFG